MPVEVHEQLARFAELENQRMPFDNVAQQLADTMYPMANDIQTLRWPGELRTQRLYDQTGMISAERLSGFMYSLITNFNTSWFQFRMGEQAQLDQEGEAWLDDVREMMQEEMTADDSALPQSVQDVFHQEVIFGTACHYVDEQPIMGLPITGFRGFTSTALPWGTYVIAENAAHRVDTVYRKFKLTTRQAVQQWGVDAIAPGLRDQVRDGANQRALGRVTEYIHGVFPRQERDRERTDRSQMPWASVYIDREHTWCVDDGGFAQFPYQTLRWGKPNLDIPWGFGRGHLALPEVLTLNAIDHDALRALRMHIFPPVWVIGAGRETLGTVVLRPGAINPIATGASVQWTNPGGNFDVQRLSLQERRERIKQIFFLDILEQIPPLSGQPRGNITAFEIAQRIRLTSQVLGPAFMRILHEFLNPFIDRCFGMLLAARVFPEPPDSIIRAAAANDGRIDVEYEGPLARATQHEDVLAIEQWLQQGMAIAQATGDPSILDNVDLDESWRRSGRVLGVPQRLIRDLPQVRRLRQARQQQQQAQAEQQQALQAAEALGKAAPGLEVLQQQGQGAQGGVAA